MLDIVCQDCAVTFQIQKPPLLLSFSLSRWEIIDPYWANFLWKYYSASIYLIYFKFGTVKDIFMVNVSIVLDFLFFVFLAGNDVIDLE